MRFEAYEIHVGTETFVKQAVLSTHDGRMCALLSGLLNLFAEPSASSQHFHVYSFEVTACAGYLLWVQ